MWARKDSGLNQDQKPKSIGIYELGHRQCGRAHRVTNSDATGSGFVEHLLTEYSPVDRQIQRRSRPVSGKIPCDALHAIESGYDRTPNGSTETCGMSKIDRHRPARLYRFARAYDLLPCHICMTSQTQTGLIAIS